MKFIRKSNLPPASFTRWCRRNKRKDWQLFSNPANSLVKQELAEQLKSNQGWICCYCESRIDESGTHIEHLKPRKDYPKNQFDWDNLLSSCNGNPLGKSCGPKKDRWYSNAMVSPLAPDCEQRFIYTGYGEILPRDPGDNDAKETIVRLGLDSAKLNALRRQLYIEIVSYRDCLDDFEFNQYVNAQLVPDGQGKFREYWTLIRYLGT